MKNNFERHYRIGQVAEVLGMSIANLRLYLKNGTIKGVRTPGGHWRIPEREILRLLGLPETENSQDEGKRCAIYARVSSKKQQKTGNLERQVERLCVLANEREFDIIKIIADVGSGLNENRKGLKRLFKLVKSNQIDVVLVEFRDRLTRFGYWYIAEHFRSQGVEILVKEELNQKTNNKRDLNQELVDDLISIVYSFSGKLYGRRSAKFRKIKQDIKQTIEIKDVH